MSYAAFSLNGTWEMSYQEEAYTAETLPVFKGEAIPDAVPGYWEDMTDRFAKAEFYRTLRTNPAYGLWQYPIAQYCPDLALPNICGNFFYRRTFLCQNISAPAAVHFGGVHNAVSVWLNGVFLGRHEGYSTAFELPVPDGLLKDGENTLVLSVSNRRLLGFDGQPVVGITSRAASECCGGIWGDVELRVYTRPLRDLAVRIAEDCSTAAVTVATAEPVRFSWAVLDEGTVLKTGSAAGDFSVATAGLT
jgi:hypothetical protein